MNATEAKQLGTKDRILDTAERLFAQNGFEATSLRAITAEAEVNLAAVNYHFQSKEALIRAVIGRRLGPINERRLQMLDESEAAAGDGPVPLEQILTAFLMPVFDARLTGRSSFGRILARIYTEPEDFLQVVYKDHLAGVAHRFVQALSKALPHLPETELVWRMHFAVGGMLHTVGAAYMLRSMSNGRCDPSDAEATAKRMMLFVKAGLEAPAPE